MPLTSIGLCILLLLIANGSPVLIADIFRSRWAYPVDAGLRFFDQRPLLGKTKTWRGIIVAVLLTSLAALLLGQPWQLGAAFAALAMLGDLSASFLKRRLAIVESGRAWLLDQIPEALLPLLVLQGELGLSGRDIVLVVVIFILLDTLLSPLLYRLHLRKRPY